MNISCFFGLHKWKHYYSNFADIAAIELFCLKYELEPTTRTCKKCNKKQKLDFYHIGIGNKEFKTAWNKFY